MRIVPRSESGLAPAKSRTKMKLPVGELWIHHTVTPVTNDPFKDWRLVQSVAFSRGFSDISYSYGVHPSGIILEGRGDYVGAHTQGRNSTSLGCVLIGNYEEQQPTKEMIQAVQWLRDWLIDNNKLRGGKTYPTGGHRDVASTACPGRNAYAKLNEMRGPLNLAAPVSAAPEGVPVANAPFAAILVHPSGGYLEIGEDGGIFAWGGAPFYGSLGGVQLNQPIVDAAWTPDYGGYYLIARDGGIFSFGNAQHQGNALWQG